MPLVLLVQSIAIQLTKYVKHVHLDFIQLLRMQQLIQLDVYLIHVHLVDQAVLVHNMASEETTANPLPESVAETKDTTPLLESDSASADVNEVTDPGLGLGGLHKRVSFVHWYECVG